jgi:hypothetical protein
MSESAFAYALEMALLGSSCHESAQAIAAHFSERSCLAFPILENYVRTFLCENWWHLQRAIKKSLETKDDPRPPCFVIASNLNRFVAEPKTLADLAVADTARIRD